jgi:hypothetical protein
MILNSKNNNFIITIPKNFVYPSIVKKYETYLKRLPLPYDSVSDYLNASVQAMSFPSLSTELVEQVLYEDPVSAKGGKRIQTYLSRDFTMTFKSYEGYINYWIMYDLLWAYWDLDNKNKFLPDITLTFMDHTGFEFITVVFKQIILYGISEIELNYSSNTAEFKTFTAQFKYNYIDIQKRLQ